MRLMTLIKIMTMTRSKNKTEYSEQKRKKERKRKKEIAAEKGNKRNLNQLASQSRMDQEFFPTSNKTKYKQARTLSHVNEKS